MSTGITPQQPVSLFLEQTLHQAITLHQAGQLQDAERLYRAILQAWPNHPDAHHNLGVLAVQVKQPAGALPHFKAALSANPNQGQYWLSYIDALIQTGKADAARQMLEHGLQRGLRGEAVEKLAVRLASGARVAEQSNAAFQHPSRESLPVSSAVPKKGDIKFKVKLTKLDKSARNPAIHREKNPSPQEISTLVTLFNEGRFKEAVFLAQTMTARFPLYGVGWKTLGAVLMRMGRSTDALAPMQQAATLLPSDAEAHSNLGNTLSDLGRRDEATTSYRRALQINPDFADAHSNLLFCLSHDETVTPAALFSEHVKFGERFESIWREHRPAHANAREPFRRLRLGFVSGDLRNHSVANFIEPVWAAIDHTQVEVVVYSNFAGEDHVTERLRALSHYWHKVVGWRDAELAAQIRADGIDVLFDLSGHTAHNRLLTFALKPAPIQVTWIGYPNTTGLRAIDYVLCDRYNSPHGLYEHFYVEKFARLPSSGTFAPTAGAPPLNALPALGNGHVTFGSFNRVSKLGDQVIGAWSQVLKAVTGSRLLLGNVSDHALAQQLAERFGRHGIVAERLMFRPKVSLQDYLALHHEVDIILDTWPYTGGTTTNHALWMGVPVVTLLGPARAQCQSAAVLGRLGLEDWVARDVEEFERIAVHWANSPKELARLRAGMRERWQAAPLRQPATVARGLEKAVRVMWQRWCAGLPAEHFEIDQDVMFDSTGLN